MPTVLSAWAVDPVPTALVVLAGAAYLSCYRTVVRRRRGGRAQRSRWGRPTCFVVGLLVLLLALDGPPDVLSDSTLSMHMLQHMLLQMVAAPLLLLGGPVSLLLRADPPWLRRRVLVAVLRSAPVRWLTHPVTALGLFSVVLVATHLTGFYELALEHERVHAFEHALYLATALLLWWPAIGVDPAPHRMSYAARVLYLFLMMPVPSLLGVAIADAGRVMYPFYVGQTSVWGTGPLADQHAAGTLLWVAAMFTAAPALTIVGWKWLDRDEREQARRDRLRTLAPTR
ncbi:MAG TPA: cytochrome c oxidase assembly protein [Nocardioidaceae bacterium]|nr:cytochrome c oxidase assembly protein [Nocardioidaceae bacterium]